jgi:hypothetical protein
VTSPLRFPEKNFRHVLPEQVSGKVRGNMEK